MGIAAACPDQQFGTTCCLLFFASAASFLEACRWIGCPPHIMWLEEQATLWGRFPSVGVGIGM